MAELIDDDELRAPKILREELEALLVTINKVIDTGKKLGTNIEGAKSTNELKKANTELASTQKELMGVEAQMAKLQAQNTNEYRFQAKQLAALKKELKEKSILGRKDAQDVSAQNSSLNQLSAALKKNQAEWASLKNEKVRGSKAGQDLLKIIQTQDKQLQELNKTIKKNTLGEFTDTMKDLKTELKKAKDEMAHLADTVGVESEEFKTASLKAGELADKIGDIQEATKSVSGEPIERMGGSFDLIMGKLRSLDFKGAAAGVKQFAAASKELTFKQATQGIGTFTKSIGTMGKALLTNPIFLIVAIFIAVGAAVYALKDKIKVLTIAFDLVGDAISYVIQLGKDFMDSMGLSTFAADEKAEKIVAAAEKEIAAIEKRYDYELRIAESAGKETADIEKKKWTEIRDEAGKGMNALVDQMNLHNGKLTEDQQEQWDKFIDIVANANVELQVLENKRIRDEENKRKEAAAKRKEAMLKEVNDLFKLRQFRLQVQIETQQEIAENEEKGIQERLAAIQKGIELRRKLAFLEAANELKASGLTASARILINEQLQKKLFDIEQKGVEERDKINDYSLQKEKEAHDKRIEAARKAADAAVKAKENEIQLALNAIKDFTMESLKNDKLTADQRNKIIEQSNKEYEQLQRDAADEVVQANIDALNKILITEKLTKEERAAIEQELFDLKTKLTDTLYEQINTQEQTRREKLEEDLAMTLGMYTMFADSVSNLFASLTERRLQNIQEEQDAITKQMENELALAEGNEEAKSQIKNKFERENAALEAKKRAEQRKAAQQEKAVALVQAAIAGALAVVKALGSAPPPLNFILAAITGAAAAIQIAAIASKPIPAYAEGTMDHPGGFAILGDGGGPELYKEPGKPWKLSAGKPTVMDLSAHTQVIPYEPSLQMIAAEGLAYSMDNDRAINNAERQAMEQISRDIRSLEKTVRNKPNNEFNITEKGVRRAMKNAESRTYLMNELFK